MTVEPGRSGENWDDLPRIAAGDSFDFACAGCGGCCRGRRGLGLSGDDLYRIARRLGVAPPLWAGGGGPKRPRPPPPPPPPPPAPPPPAPHSRRLFCVVPTAPPPSMPQGRWPVRSTRWGRASTL